MIFIMLPISRRLLFVLMAATTLFASIGHAQEQDARIENRVAEFSGIDKITGRIIKFDVYIDETVQFGALQVTPRVCYSRPPTVTPKTTAFIEVDEMTLDRKIRRIFTNLQWTELRTISLSAEFLMPNHINKNVE